MMLPLFELELPSTNSYISQERDNVGNVGNAIRVVTGMHVAFKTDHSFDSRYR